MLLGDFLEEPPPPKSCERSGCPLAEAGGSTSGRPAHARRRRRGRRGPGINSSISGREGGALAAATASGSHYHRRQRLHRRRLDPRPSRRRLRPHPIPCSRSPREPGPGNSRPPISAGKQIVEPGRPGFKSRPCPHLLLTARAYPLGLFLAKRRGDRVRVSVDPDVHPLGRPRPASAGTEGHRFPRPRG